MTCQHHQSRVALSVLVVLQLTMLGALFTQTAPHPPLHVPPFALGPFLGSSLSLAVAALVLGGTTSRSGAITCAVASLLALVSFGPQKWFDPAIAQIWPAVLLGQLAAITLIVFSIKFLRSAAARGD